MSEISRVRPLLYISGSAMSADNQRCQISRYQQRLHLILTFVQGGTCGRGYRLLFVTVAVKQPSRFIYYSPSIMSTKAFPRSHVVFLAMANGVD